MAKEYELIDTSAIDSLEIEGQMSFIDDLPNYTPDLQATFRKSNTLMARIGSTSLMSEKILLLGLSHVEKREKKDFVNTIEGAYYQELFKRFGTDFSDGYVAAFSASQLKKLLMTGNHAYYNQIDTLLNSAMFRAQWQVMYVDDDISGCTVVVTGSCYDKARGMIYIKFNNDLKDYIYDVRKDFTYLDKTLVMKMRSLFALQLYQLLKDKLGYYEDIYRKKGLLLPHEIPVEFSLEELRFYTGILSVDFSDGSEGTKKVVQALSQGNLRVAEEFIDKASVRRGSVTKAKTYGDLRRFGLKKAFLEINGFKEPEGLSKEQADAIMLYEETCGKRMTSDIHFRYVPKKSGQKVIGIRFFVRWAKLEDDKKAIEQKSDVPIDAIIRAGRIIDTDLAVTDLEAIVKAADGDLDRVQAIYEYVRTKHPDKLVGYMIKGLKEGWRVSKPDPKRKSSFSNFQEREYEPGELAELEKRLLGN